MSYIVRIYVYVCMYMCVECMYYQIVRSHLHSAVFVVILIVVLSMHSEIYIITAGTTNITTTTFTTTTAAAAATTTATAAATAAATTAATATTTITTITTTTITIAHFNTLVYLCECNKTKRCRPTRVRARKEREGKWSGGKQRSVGSLFFANH